MPNGWIDEKREEKDKQGRYDEMFGPDWRNWGAENYLSALGEGEWGAGAEKGSRAKRRMGGASEELHDFWEEFKGRHGGMEPRPHHFAYAGLKEYQQNPLIRQISRYLRGDEMRDTLTAMGTEQVRRAGTERRRRTGEGIARAGLEGTGMGTALQHLGSFQEAQQLGDVFQQAEMAQLSARQNWGLATARDMSDLWARLANTFLSEEGLAAGGEGSEGWAEFGSKAAEGAIAALISAL
ncbi:MAG: hypothetical protein GY937_20150 [bacterium]|nr:hypothetical protein [bacterium]